MPRLDRRFFEEMSATTKFQVDILEKSYRLTELLREITDTKLGKLLVLKGGTSINFVYFDIPRLSVDIDMDYIGSVQRETMLDDREKIGKVLRRIYKNLGYELDEDQRYALQRDNLYYENSARNRDRIKVETNYLKRTTILKTVNKVFRHPFPYKSFEIRTLNPNELFARKLAALVMRTAPKDLYDLYDLLRSDISFDREILRKCFIFSLCLSGDPREADFKVFDHITGHDFSDTGDLHLR